MNGWKVTAIIFIVIAIVQAVFIIWIFNIGNEMIENENECAYNICFEDERYIYYDDESLCECYTSDFQLTKQVYIS